MRIPALALAVLTGCPSMSPLDPAALPFFNNSRPVARASAPEQAPLGTPLLLDGTGSYDPDEDELRWQWRVDEAPPGSELPGNPFSVNDSRNAAITEVLLDVPGIHVFALQVVDPDGATSYTTYVTVLGTIDDAAPNADAGPDQDGVEGDLLCVDGARSSDPRGRALTYEWDVAARPEGSTLDDGRLLPDGSEVCFTPDRPGRFLLSLVVEAGGRSSAPDFVEVLVVSTNQRPVAAPTLSAGASCSTVVLDGSASSDPDGDLLEHRWDLLLAPFGSRTPLGEAAFADSTAATATFYADVPGEYLAQLVVNDGEQHSAPVLLPMELAPKTANAPPVVLHNEDMYVRRIPNACWLSCNAVEVVLDAFGTTDPDGDLVDVTWEVVSGDATLSEAVGLEVGLELAPPPAECTWPVPRNLVEVEVTATDCSGGTDVSRIVIAYDCG